jgi:hypothetical protein
MHGSMVCAILQKYIEHLTVDTIQALIGTLEQIIHHPILMIDSEIR